jgi:hypothetical protein
MKEAMKPATDLVANMQAETEARDAAELATLTAELVNAGFINEDKTDTLTLDVARALAEKLPKKKGAKTVNAHDNGEPEDEFAGYSLNSLADKEV